MKEILAGKKTHPMVDHFREEHSGHLQEVLFRTIGQFQTALERQVWESVEIDYTTASIGLHCLNSKTEWGSSNDPALANRGNPVKKSLARVFFCGVPLLTKAGSLDRPHSVLLLRQWRPMEAVVESISTESHTCLSRAVWNWPMDLNSTSCWWPLCSSLKWSTMG